MNCPMNLAGVREKIHALYDVPTHVGTHDF